MSTTNKTLLPSGFDDLLPPQAGEQDKALSSMMGVFSRFGYERIKPPLVEFEETLLAKGTAGQKLDGQTFRMMDPQGNRMLALRSDITPQIARIASSRLKGRHRPLRLAYASDVVIARGQGRQMCQVGCELIGKDDVIESMLIALVALKSAGVGDITLDVTMPGRVDSLDLSPEARLALSRRDVGAVEKLAPEVLPLLKSCGKLKDFDELSYLYDEITAAMRAYEIQGVDLSVDPITSRGFEYHDGLGFCIFAKGAGGEIGRGGRYRLPSGEVACGLSLYLERVLEVLPPDMEPHVERLGHNTPWSKIRALQDAGKIAVRD